MKLVLISLLMLAALPVVVDGKRRRVPFMNCPSTKSNSDLVSVKPARSRIECSVMCLNDPDCLSASFCKSSDDFACELSGLYLNGGCSGLPANGDCTQTAVVYPCENGGTFIADNRTCQCADGFIGDYCQRRYRDCKETPRGNVEYIIQPFGSNYTFPWRCGPFSDLSNVLTELIFVNTYNMALSWETMRQGIPVNTGFFFTGLENLHQLTKQGVYDLYIKMIFYGVDRGRVIYKNFRVNSQAEGYTCHWDSFEGVHNDLYSNVYLDGLGALGDITKTVNGARFGTFDNDVNGCASAGNFAWWFNPLGCSMIRFNEHSMFWPTNRTGTIEMEAINFTRITLNNRLWYTEDDLVL